MTPIRRLSSRGFTLVEALVVGCIVAVALCTAVPSFGRFIDQQRLEGAASQLAADLQLVRTEAIMRNLPVRLSVYPLDAGSCTVMHTGARADCSCSAAGPAACTGDATELKTVHWPSAGRMQLTATAPSLLFDPLHGTSTPAGSFNVTDANGRTIRHVVNLMGRVRSCSPDGSVAGYKPC